MFLDVVFIMYLLSIHLYFSFKPWLSGITWGMVTFKVEFEVTFCILLCGLCNWKVKFTKLFCYWLFCFFFLPKIFFVEEYHLHLQKRSSYVPRLEDISLWTVRSCSRHLLNIPDESALVRNFIILKFVFEKFFFSLTKLRYEESWEIL